MISDKANIHPDAKIDSNVIIEPFATIYGDVHIGEGTWIGPNTIIMDGARIGKNCKIFPGSVISAIPQDLKFKGESTTTEIGDNTTIRECATINRGTSDRFRTVVGKDCLIMAYAHIAHDCVIGNHCILSNYVGLAGHVTIEDWAILEGFSGVQQFLTIGKHSFLGAYSKVRKNVPPYIKAARDPLSYVGVNSVGLKRRGFTSTQISNIEDVYRILYVRNTNISRALGVIDAEVPQSPEKNEIIDFINSSSDKGIIRGMV